MDERLEKSYLDEELYEKQVIRERKRRILLISFSFVVFMILCGFPVYQERLPKWKSLESARRIAVEIERIKTESIRDKRPILLTVFDRGQFKVEQVASCVPDSLGVFQNSTLLREGVWTEPEQELALIGPDDAKRLKLNRLFHQICYDPIKGIPKPEVKKVMMVVPVKDLAESRLDRASFVEVESAMGQISIN